MAEAVQQLVTQIEKLTVAELVDLIKNLEEKFDLKSFMIAAPAASAQAGGAGGAAEAPAGGGKVNIVLSDAGANKISVIKIVKELKPDVSLQDAKALVDNVPSTILEGVEADKAKEIVAKILATGAKAEAK